MAEKLFYDNNSTISKLENNQQSLKISLMIEWLVITKRIDILFLLLKGMAPDYILKVAFTDEYLRKLSMTDIPNITLDEINERLENPNEIFAHLNLDKGSL